MKKSIRSATFIMLVIWSTHAFAQWSVVLTVPLEVTSLIEPVARVVVMCFVKAGNDNSSSPGSGEVAVDVNTGRPLQDRVVVRVDQRAGTGSPPSSYICHLRPTGPPSNFVGGGIPAPSTHPKPEWQPAPGTPLVEKISGEIP